MGGSEAQFIRGGLRWTLTATYKGEGGGSILFHQMGWDPVFLRDIDPEQPIDLAATLRTKVFAFLLVCPVPLAADATERCASRARPDCLATCMDLQPLTVLMAVQHFSTDN